MQRILALLLYTIAFSHTVSAQKTIALAQTGYEQFIARAKQSRKPVMIYFTGTGCALCVEMEKQVFTKPEVYELYNKSFVNVESFDDSKKPDPATKALRQKYGVVSNPTFIFIDTDGNIIHKSGYRKDSKGFLLVGQQAQGTDNYRAWSQKIEQGSFDRITLEKYLSVEQQPSLYAEENYQCKSQVALDRYFASIPEKEYTAKQNWHIIESYVANPYSDIFTHLLENPEKYSNQSGEKAVVKKIYTVLNDAWSGASNGKAYKDAESFITSSNSPIAKLVVRMRTMRSTREDIIKKKSGWQDFINQYDSLASAYAYLDKPFQVYSATADICNRFPKDKQLVTTSHKWIGAIIALGKNDPDFYAVYAQTFFLLGDKQNAILNQQKAINIALSENADKEDLDLLKKGLSQYKK